MGFWATIFLFKIFEYLHKSETANVISYKLAKKKIDHRKWIIIIIILLELLESIHQEEFIVYVPVPIETSGLWYQPGFDQPRTSWLCKCAISRAGCPLSMSSHDLSRLYTRTPRHSAGKLFQFVLVSLIGHREFAQLLILLRTYFFLLLFPFLPPRIRRKYPRNRLIIKICIRRSSI